MEAMIARGAQVFLALSGAYLVALWFVLVVWTFRDVEARSKNIVTQMFSTVLVVLFFIPGLLLYMILRPKETLDEVFQRSLEEEYLLQDLQELPTCMACHRFVEEDFMLCPHCQTKLRDACPACDRMVDLRWELCPYCGTEQGKRQLPIVTEETAPARFVAAARRRQELMAGEQPSETPAAFVPAPLSVVTTTNGVTQIRPFDRRKTRTSWRRPAVGEQQMTGTNGNAYDESMNQPTAEYVAPMYETKGNGNGNGNGQDEVAGAVGKYESDPNGFGGN